MTTQRSVSSSKSGARGPHLRIWILAGLLLASSALSWVPVARAEGDDDEVFNPLLRKSHKEISFDLVRSPGIVNAGCLPRARGHVQINSIGQVEIMTVEVEGLPPRTGFDFFVIQVPNPPFGLSWYQGDIETNADGRARQRFIGRFNLETFIVAPGSQPAPVVHPADASSNPPTAPVHTYHVGLWFNSPSDAGAAGCPGATTPFNGDHTAGVQVLNTSNFPDTQGPLHQLTP